MEKCKCCRFKVYRFFNNKPDELVAQFSLFDDAFEYITVIQKCAHIAKGAFNGPFRIELEETV